ncbi:MAG: hypothetical protein KDA61_07055 [Planctomycetales bacterium]|nr:hypothetical protein [Planctomycetales bacterium]
MLARLRPASPRARYCLIVAVFASALAVTRDGCAWPGSAPAAPGAPPAPGMVERATCSLRRWHLRCQQSVAGKLLANMVKPVSKLTGGLIPPCPDNQFAAAVELQASAPPATGPGGEPLPPPPPPPSVAAAAKIKTEQAEAQMRRDAVAYLAGVDCRYYPEAEAALIASLRADRSECVRLEAARSLTKCGCCTPAIIQALTICVKGSEEDGNPAERSQRVRQTALCALNRCQCAGGASGGMPRPETPLASADGEAAQVAYQTDASPGPNCVLEASPPATSLLRIWRSSGSAPAANADAASK